MPRLSHCLSGETSGAFGRDPHGSHFLCVFYPCSCHSTYKIRLTCQDHGFCIEAIALTVRRLFVGHIVRCFIVCVLSVPREQDALKGRFLEREGMITAKKREKRAKAVAKA